MKNTQAYTYFTLSKIQRKAIDAFIEIDPSMRDADSISRKKLEEMFAIAREKNPKLGYPSFLTRVPKVARAVYPWPGPESKPFVTNEDLTTIVAPKAKDEFEEKFMQEMHEHGII